MRTPKPRPARSRAEDTGCRPTLHSASPAGGGEQGGPGTQAKPGSAPSWFSGSVTQPSRLLWNQASSKLSASSGLSRLLCKKGGGAAATVPVGRSWPLWAVCVQSQVGQTTPGWSPRPAHPPRSGGCPGDTGHPSTKLGCRLLWTLPSSRREEGRARGPGECRPERKQRPLCTSVPWERAGRRGPAGPLCRRGHLPSELQRHDLEELCRPRVPQEAPSPQGLERDDKARHLREREKAELSHLQRGRGL